MAGKTGSVLVSHALATGMLRLAGAAFAVTAAIIVPGTLAAALFAASAAVMLPDGISDLRHARQARKQRRKQCEKE